MFLARTYEESTYLFISNNNNKFTVTLFFVVRVVAP